MILRVLYLCFKCVILCYINIVIVGWGGDEREDKIYEHVVFLV